ncbi:MAG: PilZ domain-containing protein [Magnetococcus sp. DMHC-6]
MPNLKQQDNIPALFATYGTIVSDFFSSDCAIDEPIKPFIHEKMSCRASIAAQFDSSILDTKLAARLKSCQEHVNHLRRQLANVEKRDPRSVASDNEAQLLQIQLNAFRKALETGKESALSENAFYKLTILVYHLNLEIIKNYFIFLQSNQTLELPQILRILPTHRQIWGRSLVGANYFLGNIGQTLIKWLSSFKFPLGIFLFCGSTMTTAKGVIDLFQTEAFIDLFGSGLSGAENEDTRLLISILTGFMLSSAILDFKGRIFLGIAEAGRFFQGIKDAFAWNPRWFVIALLLTGLSIKTNYDGIVLLLSQKGDLANQMMTIQNRVYKALGADETADASRLESLHDLQAALAHTSTLIDEQFAQIPNDEVSGAASSGDARKGPRYWGKYYIVYGGYKFGSTDVNSAINHQLSKEIDRMLLDSKQNFNVSLSDKIKDIRSRYENNLAKTQKNIEKNLAILAKTLSMGDFTPEEIWRVFSIESFHINNYVQEIVRLLEMNKRAYEQTANQLNQLIEDHIQLLRKVDKAGVSKESTYHISTHIEIPKIEAIDELRKGGIPMAQRKNLDQLRESLLASYGVVLGGSILTFILILSVGMDLADPFVYGYMTARWGRRDRARFAGYLERLQEWENQFIHATQKFFDTSLIRLVLPGLEFPQEPGIRNAFYMLLEEMDPIVKDQAEQMWVLKARYWFIELFVTARIHDVTAYNARVRLIHKMVAHKTSYFSTLLEKILPGLEFQRFSQEHFRGLHEQIMQGLTHNREALSAHIEAIQKIEIKNDLNTPKMREHEISDLSGKLQHFDWNVGSILQKIWSFLCVGTLKQPIPPFSYTRRQWLLTMSNVNRQFGGHVDQFYAMVPSIKEMIFIILPQIREEIVDPLEEAFQAFANHVALRRTAEVDQLLEEFNGIEEGLLKMWGLSQIKSSQTDEETLYSIASESGLEDIIASIKDYDGTNNPLRVRIETLRQKLTDATEQIRQLALAYKLLFETLPEIKKEFLDPINTLMSGFANPLRLGQQLGIDLLQEEFFKLYNRLKAVFGLSDQANNLDDLNSEQAFVQMNSVPVQMAEIIQLLTGSLEGGGDFVDRVSDLRGRLEQAFLKLQALSLEQKQTFEFALKIWLETFPELKKLFFDPLDALLGEFSNSRQLEDALGIDHLRQEFFSLQDRLQTVLGITTREVFSKATALTPNMEEVVLLLTGEFDGGLPLVERMAVLRNQLKEAMIRLEKIQSDLAQMLVSGRQLLFQTFPQMQRNYLDPLTTLMIRFPNGQWMEQIFGIDQLREEFWFLYDRLKAALGYADEVVIYSGTPEQEEEVVPQVEELVRLLSSGSSGTTDFQNRVNMLEHNLQESLAYVQRMESVIEELFEIIQQLKSYSEEIRQILTKINFREMEMRKRAFQFRDKLLFLEENRPLLDGLPAELLTIKKSVDDFMVDRMVMKEENLPMLRDQHQRMKYVYERVVACLQTIEKTSSSVIQEAFLEKKQSLLPKPRVIAPVEPIVKKEFLAESTSENFSKLEVSPILVKFQFQDGSSIYGSTQSFHEESVRVVLKPLQTLPAVGTRGRLILVVGEEVEVVEAEVVWASGLEMRIHPVQSDASFEKGSSSMLFEAEEGGQTFAQCSLPSNTMDPELEYIQEELLTEAMAFQAPIHTASVNISPEGVNVDQEGGQSGRAFAIHDNHAIGRSDFVPKREMTMALVSQEAEFDFEGGRRREGKRTEFQTPLVLITDQGERISGMTKNVSLGGVTLITNSLTPPLSYGDQGVFIMDSDIQKREIPYEVVWKNGNQIGLKILLVDEKFTVKRVEKRVFQSSNKENVVPFSTTVGGQTILGPKSTFQNRLESFSKISSKKYW